MAWPHLARLRDSLPAFLGGGGSRRLPLTETEAYPGERAGDLLTITGERILLRPLCLDDAEAFFAYAGDSDVTRYLPWNAATTVESVRPFLAEEMWRGRRGDSLRLALVLRETGAVVGSTDLVDLIGARKNGQAEMGYLLAKAFWGRGLMSEAAYLTARHGFDVLRLRSIVSFVDAENIASVRVLEKIGMRDVGHETRIVKGEDRLYRRFALQRGDLRLPAPVAAEGTDVRTVKSIA